jgi:hypothetical protein
MADGSGTAGTIDAGAGGGAGDAGAAAAASAAAGAAGAGNGAGTAAIETAVQEAPWYGELSPDDIGWLQNKQYFGADPAKADVRKSFPGFVKAHRSMESLVGDPSSRVVIPKEGASKEDFDAFYSKLGRPADPTGYELKAGEGGDQKVADRFSALAHETGLTKQQVQALAPKWDAFAKETVAAREAAAEQQYQSTAAAEMEGLRTEWAGNYDAKCAAAQRAKVAFGLEPEVMNRIERAIGTKRFVSLLSDVGMSISEDRGAGQGEGGLSVMTPEAARARLKELGNDKAWVAKYMANDAETVAEKRKIDNILANAAAR